MEKETIRIIAIHPVNGAHIKKIEFTSEDEEFLGDIQGFDSFEEYVDYYVNVEIDTFEQGGYTVISAKEEEVKDIIIELLK